MSISRPFEPSLPSMSGRRFVYICTLMLLCLTASLGMSSAVSAQPVEIGNGILDDEKILGPKWVRVNFSPLATGNHVIRVVSDETADIRFSVWQILNNPPPNDKIRIGTSINAATLADWEGMLDITEQYYLGIWAVTGSSDFSATIEIPATLTFLSQPADLTVIENDNASFSVAATGAGVLGYQWYENEQPITGATTNSYSIVGATLQQNGNSYRVDVTDDNGTLSSDTATLSVQASLSIATQPMDQTITEGSDAVFSVVAAGTGALSYQWYENEQPISGATAASYSVVAATVTQDGNSYRVDVTDDTGTLSSDTATLTVQASLSITTTTNGSNHHRRQ